MPGSVAESWWLVSDATVENFTSVGEFVNFVVQTAEQGATSGWCRRHEISQHGKPPQRFTQGNQFSRTGVAESDAAGEALEILNAAQFLADFAAHYSLLNKMGDRVEAFFDRVAVNQGTKNPRA